MRDAAHIVSVDAAEVPALIAQGFTQLGEHAD
jgi:hypothetical protein